MTARLIDGKAHAAQLRAAVAARVQAIRAEGQSAPCLAGILVGDDPAAHAYWRSNRKACEEAGIAVVSVELPAATDQAALHAVIDELNARTDVHAILLHAPLPSGLNMAQASAAITLLKDVDGVNPTGLAALAFKDSNTFSFPPATPAGVLRLLALEQIPLQGARVVVIGRSRVVGLPLSLLLLREDATVTIAHSRSIDLPSIAREADILIAAAGRPGMVGANWIKSGAIVIDVGINRIADPANLGKLKTVGDVDFAAVAPIAGAITPVPGGTGPMTVAVMLEHILRAYESEYS